MQPIWNEPALIFKLTEQGQPHTYLAAGELHIGFENELARRGAYLKSRTQDLANRLLQLARDHGATRLLLLGDVKHRVTHLTPQERRDLPAFFERLGTFDRVDIVVGNHDAGLRTLLRGPRFAHVRFHAATGLLLEGDETRVACLHGHAWPRPALLAADTFLVSHTHVALALVDEQGVARTEWAWLRAPLHPDAVRTKYGKPSHARAIVFPPFNPLLGGTAVNREGLLGPFAKLIDLRAAEFYLLDGRRLDAKEVFPSSKPTRLRPSRGKRSPPSQA